jgi:ABC-type Fe3+ transport system permease subunit
MKVNHIVASVLFGGVGLFFAILAVSFILYHKETLDLFGTKLGEFCIHHPIASSSVIVGSVVVIIFRQTFKSH